MAQRAAGQWTMVSVRDLRDCGVSRRAIAGRVAAGRLFPFHRGVYSIVPNPPLEGCFLAAVMACGDDSALSHYSAAALFGWLPWDGRMPEVTSPTRRVHPHIHTHEAAVVDRIFFKRIPVIAPAQTAIDLSAFLPLPRLRRAVHEGLNRRQLRPTDLITRGHRGAAKLRLILASAAPTRNEYEDIALLALLGGGLPKPRVNAREGRYFPDFCWPRERVIVEADSARFHGHMLARADDRARQAELNRAGWTVLRTTWNEVTTRPDRLVARVKRVLATRAAS